MSANFKTLLFVAIFGLLAGSAIGWSVCRYNCKFDGKKTQVDTITVTRTVRDTIRITETKLVKVEVIDTAIVPVMIRDTVHIGDTVHISLPLERKTWQDSTYKIQTTGYNTTLDFVEVYPLHTYTDRTITIKERHHWGVGVSAGYGVGIKNSTLVGVPYVGIGISYNILTW